MSKPSSKIRVQFLGTGPAVAIPRFAHTDQTCRDAKKKNTRTRRMRSSVLVIYKNTKILIDAGPDFLAQISKIRGGLTRLDAVFLTHEHLDATGGLHDLNSWAATKNITLSVYGLGKTWQKIKDAFSNLKFVSARSGRMVTIGTISVTPFSVRHGIQHDVPTLGFHVTTQLKQHMPQQALIYASDMDGALKSSTKFFKHIELVIIDAAMWFGKKINGHFSPDQAINFLKPLKPKKIILTQIGHSWPPYKIAVKEIKKYCKKKKTSFQVIVAYDGMCLEL